MDISSQFDLEHLLFKERICRSCGETKDLIEDFYLTRKDRGTLPSAYAYECKVCTIRRVVKNRKRKPFTDWGYPDW